MSHFFKLAQSIMFGLLFGVFLLTPLDNPVHAAVACQNTLPVTDGTDNDLKLDVQLSGNSLVWSKQNGQLFHYNLVTTITTPLGNRTTANPWENRVAVDTDHIVWIDPDYQVQLYTVSTATKLQLTDGTRLNADVRVEGNYVLWRQGKKPEKIKKLFVYDIAAATTTKITKTFAYNLNEGRVLWSGNLYDLATHTQTFLGEAYLTGLSGAHAAGTYFINPFPDSPGNNSAQLAIKDLNTGIVTQITDNTARSFIEGFVIEGDYISWSQYYGLEWSATLYIYQISTGETRLILPEDESASDSELTISDRFTGFFDYYYDIAGDRFVVYDIVSGSRTPMFYDPDAFSELGDIDAGRIAWVDYKLDEDDEIYATRLILRTECGATPTIVDQTPNLNILTGRSVPLRVTTSGDQPITYQWYQGIPGDTTTPIGENTNTYTTPPLTETTTYWVRTANAFIEDSDPITITPGATAELVIDGSFEQSLSYAPLLTFWKSLPYATIYQACNEPDQLPVAHSGECAAHIEGWNFNQKLTQQIAAVPYVIGDTLTLSVWLQANTIAFTDASILLKVRYADETKAKIVLKPTQSEFAYTRFTADPLTITGVVSKVQLLIKYNNPDGDWLLDDVSLLHQPASAATLPLPPTSLQSRH